MKVVSAGIGVKVKEFSDKIKAVYNAGLHGLGIHLAECHTSLCDDGLVPIVGTYEGELHSFEPAAKPSPFVAVNLVEPLVVFYMQLFERQRDELGGKPEPQGIVEDAGAVGVEVGDEAAVELFGRQGGLEVK